MASADLTSPNLYARLGVAPDASTSQITAAYRRLALALHPDSAPRGSGDPETLQLVIEAHQILADPHQRQRYDSTTNRRAQIVSRSERVTTRVCAVCRGTGTIGRRCYLCAGAGHVLAGTAWLRTPVVCPICHTSGNNPAHCGDCGGTGQSRTWANRRST